MIERGGRFILNEAELALLQQEIIHPNADALRKRDDFLASFSDVPITFTADGGMYFELPDIIEVPMKERIEIPTEKATYIINCDLPTKFSYKDNSYALDVA